jgi:hypothetical protein
VLSLDRSPQEVAVILATFIEGEESGHGADNFISIPIRSAELDAIRADFEQLMDRYPEWEPQQPFPEAGVPAVRELIGRATSIGCAKGDLDEPSPLFVQPPTK